MAANISFKQQCPSCEAMVTIRDDGLIGKKIDCPKCKYRFVVEEPAEEEDEFEEEAPPKKKGKAAKGKAGKRRDDDDDDDRPRKKEGGSKKLVLGLVIGGAALLLLIAAGVLLIMNMGGSADTKKSTPTVSAGSRGAGAAPQKKDDEDNPPNEEKKKEEAPKPSDVAATNLLPNDTEMVVNLMPQELLASPLGRTAFDTPGAFQHSQFQNTFGFPLDDLERVLAATNLAQKWNFFVIRTSKPVKPDAVKKALHLKKADDSPSGFEYFTIASEWLNKEVSRLNDPNLSKLPIPITPGPHPLAVRFHDPQTIVVADLAPMKKFLSDKGQPALLTKKGASEEKKQDADSEGGRGGGRGGPGMMAGMRGRPGAGGEGGPGMQGMMGRMGGGSAASSTDAPPPAPSKSYLTIKSNLKEMLDRMEAKGPVVFSLAFDTSQWKESMKSQVQFQFVKVEDLAMPKFMGFALGMKEKFTGLIGMEFADTEAARANLNQITTQLPLLPQFGPMIRMKIDVPGGGSGGGFGGGPGGFRGPGAMGGPDRGGPPPGGNQPPPGVPPGNQPPGGPGTPPGGIGRPSQADQNIGTIKIEVGSHEKTLQLTIEVTLKQEAMEVAEKELAKVWVRARGEISSAMAPSTPHKLAQAMVSYRDKNGAFPRGTFRRNPSAERQNRDWPPDQRISWMAEILPELGYSEIFQKIDPQKSWRDDENLLPAMALIPEFLDGRNPNRSHFIHYPNMLMEVAATDFVGMAGVGMDAASYDEKDSDNAKKLGIFGYDRVTKVSDISDGLPNTILLIQVPAAYKDPWLAGGGATVRGCPDTGSVKPFVSEQPDGKKGTIAIMADGAVRFIPDNIPDAVFKAMCTIKGGEKVDLDKYTTLIPPPTESSELETTAEPPPAPPKEEPPKKEPAKKDAKKEDAKKEADKE